MSRELPPSPGTPGTRKQGSGSMEAVVKAEKLTQIAFILPVSVLVGWLMGAGLDKLLHQHWIYIAGLVLGVAAGFVQLFRMIAEPSLLASTVPDLTAPRGPGYSGTGEEDDQEEPKAR